MLMVLQNIDRAEFLSINRFAQRTPGLHGFMLFLANEGIAIFIVLAVVTYLLIRFIPRWSSTQNMAKVAITGIATVAAVGINQPIAHIFKEPRPYDTLPHILVFIHRANDYSFPSDHGVMIGAVTAGLYLINPILGTTSLVLGLFVAFARVYTAAHYPHDLIVGMLLGSVITLLCYLLLKKLAVASVVWLKKTPLKALVHNSNA